MKPILFAYIFLAVMLLVSCGNSSKKEEASNEQHLIQITDNQFKTDSMSLGAIVQMPFEDIVTCNGNVVSKSNGKAIISTPVTGLIHKIRCVSGQFVNKGQVLFEISGNELIEIQQAFSETASQLKRLKSEFERTQSLYNDNIGSEKDFIFAESEYKMANAKYKALKMKIDYMGLDFSTIENGDFFSSFTIKSPINGYISQINISTGQFADQNTNMAEIIDVTQFHLKLFVFEKDVSRLEAGQKIKFNIIGNKNKIQYAVLSSIGRSVNNDTKTITCYAEIDDLKNVNYVNNAFVEAQIISKIDTVSAVCEESILKSEGEHYLLVLEKEVDEVYFLNRVKVQKGRSYNGYVEILDKTDLGTIITKGAYNIIIE